MDRLGLIKIGGIGKADIHILEGREGLENPKRRASSSVIRSRRVATW
jgi:hypothetical protein